MGKSKSRNVAVTIDNVRYVTLSSLFPNDDDKPRYRVARRMARHGNIDGARNIFGTWCVPETFDPSTVATPTRTGVHRTDGREWYRIALTESEYNTLIAGSALPDDAIVTPDQRRENAKQRRAARKQHNDADTP